MNQTLWVAAVVVALTGSVVLDQSGGAAGGGTAAQQPAFRLAVHAVPIYATVTGAAGALVANLGAGDFEVSDNGRRQRLTVFEAGVQPITVAVLLDRSPSLFGVAPRTQTAVSEFARRLLTGDRACLGTFSHVVSLVPSFTDDADVLLHHLADEAPYPAGTALWDAIEAARMALADEGGRRVILIITDAADNCSRADISEVRTGLQRDGVIVYAVGVRGRDGIDLEELGALARATGGWQFELKPADDLAATMQRIADELHRQYVLAFSAQTLDDKLHRIDVKVSRKGLTVRARRFYLASSHAPIR